MAWGTISQGKKHDALTCIKAFISLLLLLDNTQPSMSIHHIRLFDLVQDTEMATQYNQNTTQSIFYFLLI